MLMLQVAGGIVLSLAMLLSGCENASQYSYFSLERLKDSDAVALRINGKESWVLIEAAVNLFDFPTTYYWKKTVEANVYETMQKGYIDKKMIEQEKEYDERNRPNINSEKVIWDDAETSKQVNPHE